MEANKMEEWIKLLTEVLGKDCVDICEETAVLLMCVDQSVKPCFMWDHSSTEPKTLVSLLQTLLSKKLLTNPLAVVELDLDVFIVNLDALTRVLLGYLSSKSTWLIDISKPEPKVAQAHVHEVFKGYIWSILRQLGMTGHELPGKETADDLNQPCEQTAAGGSDQQDSCQDQNTKQPSTSQESAAGSSNCGASVAPAEASSTSSQPSEAMASAALAAASSSSSDEQCKLLRLNLPENVNESSIFGCLLGYPQVYWWDKDSTGSSLSGLPLKVYRFTAMCSVLHSGEKGEGEGEEEDDVDVEMFSFSVPEVLDEELRPCIQQWGNVANARVEQASLFSNAKFNCDPVLCLQVAL